MVVSKNKINFKYNDSDLENYYNQYKSIQTKEAQSDRFMNVVVFLKKYEERKSRLKEEILLKLVGNYALDDSFEMNKKNAIKRLKKIKNFYKTLYVEDIETNIYLKNTYDILSISKEECKNIIEEIINKYNNLSNSKEIQKIRLNIPIPNENLNLFKEEIPTTVQIPYYRPELRKVDTIPILDEKNIEYYNLYNEIVKLLHQIVIDIYTCRLLKYIPDDYSENIILNYFNIVINKSKMKYVISVSAKKEKVKKKKKHK